MWGELLTCYVEGRLLAVASKSHEPLGLWVGASLLLSICSSASLWPTCWLVWGSQRLELSGGKEERRRDEDEGEDRIVSIVVQLLPSMPRCRFALLNPALEISRR